MTTAGALTRVRGFIIDLDGTTYLGNRAIAGAREFLESLPELGCRHLFVTNNSSSSGQAYVENVPVWNEAQRYEVFNRVAHLQGLIGQERVRVGR